jgi:hypothetical protein
MPLLRLDVVERRRDPDQLRPQAGAVRALVAGRVRCTAAGPVQIIGHRPGQPTREDTGPRSEQGTGLPPAT